MLISCVFTAQLICAFVFEYAKSRVLHDTARTESGVVDLLNCDYINPADGRPAVGRFIG